MDWLLNEGIVKKGWNGLDSGEWDGGPASSLRLEYRPQSPPKPVVMHVTAAVGISCDAGHIQSLHVGSRIFCFERADGDSSFTVPALKGRQTRSAHD